VMTVADFRTRLRYPDTRCWHITGYEPCCCGDPACPDGGRGWPIWCHKPISRLRFVLFGACRGHRDGGAQ
jgi:hypothetical protein